MSDKSLVSQISESAYVKLLERVAIGVLVWFAVQQYNRVELLQEKLPQFEVRLTNTEKAIADIGADLDTSRRARQEDWDEIRERLTRVETQTGTLIENTRAIGTKLDSISERLPRREGMLFPGGTVNP